MPSSLPEPRTVGMKGSVGMKRQGRCSDPGDGTLDLGWGMAILLAVGLCRTPAWAGEEWDPARVSVTPSDQINGVICAPAAPTPLAESVNTIRVLDPSFRPMVGAIVTVLLTPRNPACPGAVLSGTTDSNGTTAITIAAGGCADGLPSTCVVKVDGFTVRSYVNCKSPDFDGAAADGRVDLADLLSFAREFNGVTPPGCHDYTNDNQTDLSDLIPFGAAFSTAKHCP